MYGRSLLRLFLFFLAVMVAFMAVWFVQQTTRYRPVPKASVVITLVDLFAGQEIQPEHLRAVQVDAPAVEALQRSGVQVFTTPEELQGFKTSVPVPAGTILTSNMVRNTADPILPPALGSLPRLTYHLSDDFGINNQPTPSFVAQVDLCVLLRDSYEKFRQPYYPFILGFNMTWSGCPLNNMPAAFYTENMAPVSPGVVQVSEGQVVPPPPATYVTFFFRDEEQRRQAMAALDAWVNLRLSRPDAVLFSLQPRPLDLSQMDLETLFQNITMSYPSEIRANLYTDPGAQDPYKVFPASPAFQPAPEGYFCDPMSGECILARSKEQELEREGVPVEATP